DLYAPSLPDALPISSPSRSPLSRLKLMPRKAVRSPPRTAKRTSRSFTSNSAMVLPLVQPWVHHIPQPVTQQVDDQHEHHQHQAGDQRDPPGTALDVVKTGLDQRA